MKAKPRLPPDRHARRARARRCSPTPSASTTSRSSRSTAAKSCCSGTCPPQAASRLRARCARTSSQLEAEEFLARWSTVEVDGSQPCPSRDRVAREWLADDDADPPLRGARGRDVRAGEGRRLPAPLDRRGGDDRRQRAGAARQRLPDLHLPLARPRARARHAAGERDGRAVRARRRLLAAGAAARCTCSTSRAASWAATGSSAATCRSPPGIALASDYQGTDEVTLCTFGDGASNQGTFGETLNLAALWKLPVVFMVTNNQFGMGTALRRHSAVTDLQRKGESLGVPGMRCDGMDVLDTHAVALRGGRARARGAPPAARRGRHLPLPRPLDGRPRAVPHQGGGRAVARARPDPRVRRAADARGRDRRGASASGSTREAIARVDAAVRVRRGLALPGARVALRRRLRARRRRSAAGTRCARPTRARRADGAAPASAPHGRGTTRSPSR